MFWVKTATIARMIKYLIDTSRVVQVRVGLISESFRQWAVQSIACAA